MQNLDILALAGLRLDGRKYDDIRRIKLKVGVVNNADGSVYYEQGLNKVLITVHGPQEPIRKKGNDISIDKGSIEVNLHNAPYSGVERKKHHNLHSYYFYSTRILLNFECHRILLNFECHRIMLKIYKN